MEDLVDGENHIRSIRAEDVRLAIEAVLENDKKPKWSRNVELTLEDKSWRPSAVSADGTGLLYVCLRDEIPRFVADRLRIAGRLGIEITLALPIQCLYNAEVLAVLSEVDASILVLDDFREDRRYQRRHYLAAIADIEVPVSPDLRASVGNRVLGMLDTGSDQVRGARLEALLAFLFSQVQDFKVVERNYRNASEEIDIVLQIDNFSTRVWQKSGVPFILVEAKNRKDKANQPMMSILLTKLQTKRGSARIGFLVSMAGFTEDARIQELRYSTQDLCVVMIDRDNLRNLLSATDLDGMLEDQVRRSLLR